MLVAAAKAIAITGDKHFGRRRHCVVCADHAQRVERGIDARRDHRSVAADGLNAVPFQQVHMSLFRHHVVNLSSSTVYADEDSTTPSDSSQEV